MCGIYFCLKNTQSVEQTHKHQCLQNRGPDAVSILEKDDYYAAFYRLAIVGVLDGMQPFVKDGVILLCNGEIYNHEKLERRYSLKNRSHSDCEVILHLYNKIGLEATVQAIEGEFAFVLYDSNTKLLHFARDRLGRKPLFYSINQNMIEVCSLFSGLSSVGDSTVDKILGDTETKVVDHTTATQVVPGIIYTWNKTVKCLTEQRYHLFAYNPNGDVDNKGIHMEFINAVVKRVSQSERPVGFLLSGGFDSSLVLSVALKYCKFAQPPHVFTIGFDPMAPDVLSAELMVNWLKKMYGENCIQWHKVILPISDGLDALPKVIKALETYDTTTIRASTPMYLISKYIAEKTDVKVVLSGEGSDELFGGYLYFKYAPDNFAFRAEICKLLNELYLYDVLRADRTTAEHGLEVRPPFLDDQFVSLVLQSFNLRLGSATTKEFIRNIINEYDSALLPPEILWGKKEAFSDAVGLNWKEEIVKFADKWVEKADAVEEIGVDETTSPHIKPITNEMKYFQYLFKKEFGSVAWHLLPKLWLPNQTWIKTGVEPSARVLGVY